MLTSQPLEVIHPANDALAMFDPESVTDPVIESQLAKDKARATSLLSSISLNTPSRVSRSRIILI